MGARRDHLSAIASVVGALACTGVGDNGSALGSSGAKSTGGAGATGAAGQMVSSAGSELGPGGASAAFGGQSTGGFPGAGFASGGDFTRGGAGAGGAGSGADSNAGGAVSRGGGGGRGGEFGGAPASSGASGMAGSPLAGASFAGTSSAGAGSCVEDLACTLAAPPLSADIHQDCVDRINQFRTQCACLPALERWTDGEACADQMAEYDAMQNTAHAGFQDRICSSGSGGQNECPGYSSNTQVISLCFQQMWSEGPGPQADCTGQCFQDHGHFINMTSTSMTKVACGFYTTSAGKVWAAQNFSR